MNYLTYRGILAFCFHVILVSTFQSCGSATFDGGSPNKPGLNINPGQKVEHLTWFWQCDSAPATLPVTVGSDVVINGGGEHRFKSNSFEKTPLTFSGKVCPPVSYPRDIIFVIDVSGSMGGSGGADPLRVNSCGRLKAVETIINDIVARGSDTRFGIVTFSDRVVAQSSTMFSSSANLFTDISKGNAIANTLCYAGGGTDYGMGLAAAESIFTGSRAEAIKEIYFVSDGEPEDKLGPLVASRLQSPGIAIGGKSIPVTIATAMMGAGNDTILKNEIASKDNAGAPIHAGSVQAADLAATLNKLAANEILEGKMRYRAIGAETWNEISLDQNMKDYSFSVPSITIDGSVAPKGLEVGYEYRDQHNNKYNSQGSILWTDSPTSTKLKLEENAD